MTTTTTTTDSVSSSIDDSCHDTPYSGSIIYRASFAFGSKRDVEVAIALPSFDNIEEAGANDSSSQERVDSILKQENVPSPYSEEISARLGEMLRRQRFAETSSVISQTLKKGEQDCGSCASEWALLYGAHTKQWNDAEHNPNKDVKVELMTAKRQPTAADYVEDPAQKLEAAKRRGVMFHVVINDLRENVEAVLGMEERCLTQMNMLRDNRRFLLQQTQERQSSEMEKLIGSAGQETLEITVARQMKELEDIENVCDGKEAALVQQQDRQYWSLISEIFEEKVSRDMVVAIREAPKYRDINALPVESEPPKSSQDGTNNSNLEDEDSDDDLDGNKAIYERSDEKAASATGQGSGIAKRLFERVSTDPSLINTRIASIDERSDGKHYPNDTAMLFIGQGQRKILYRLDAVCAPLFPGLVDSTFGKVGGQQHIRREATMKRLYSRALSALVIPTAATSKQWQWQSVETKLERQLREACEVAHDFHFGSLKQQIQAWQNPSQPQSKANSSSQPENISPGDVFVTKHSNLLDTHVVFHMVIDKDDKLNETSTKTSSKSLQALWNVLSLASHYDVSELTIPIPLVPAVPPGDCPDDVKVDWYMEQADVVLKNIKSFLSTYNPEGITHITFVFPESAPSSLPSSFTSSAF